MRKRDKIIVTVIMLLVIFVFFQCLPYRNGWECKKLLWRIKLEGPDCLRFNYVNIDHEKQSFSLWYDVSGGVENHVEELLYAKEILEKLLAECREIPGEYSIIIGFATRDDAIIYCNKTDDYINKITGGSESSGYQLFSVNFHVYSGCLSDLSILKDVKYLNLCYGVTIDDIAGLENMGELAFISMTGSVYNVTPDKTFTEKEQQAIKEMYPGCYISCYPVDTN